MCGAYSAGDQGEATTYYQLPPPPSLQPCTWIGPPAPPYLPSTCHLFPSLQICSRGKSKLVDQGSNSYKRSRNQRTAQNMHPFTHMVILLLILHLGVSKKEWNCLKINLPGCHPNNATCRHDLRTRAPKLRRWCCQGPPPGVVAPQMEFIRCQRGSRVKRVGPEKPLVTFGRVRNSSQIQTPGRAMDQVTFIFLFTCICNPGPSKLLCLNWFGNWRRNN